MNHKFHRTRERIHAVTLARLKALADDSTKTPAMRRAATLRLARLRAASAPAKPALTLTTKATAPAPAPTPKACIEAYESFIALSRQRRALFNKRRTPAEHEMFRCMIALMPTTTPTNNDPTEWRNFIAQVDGVLSEIKAAKNL
jgi:hypothetical protein